jgi:hypothetical protein
MGSISITTVSSKTQRKAIKQYFKYKTLGYFIYDPMQTNTMLGLVHA